MMYYTMPDGTRRNSNQDRYSHLVTRHLIHNGIEYKITHIGNNGDYVQCDEVGVASDAILRLPIKQALTELKPTSDKRQ